MADRNDFTTEDMFEGFGDSAKGFFADFFANGGIFKFASLFIAFIGFFAGITVGNLHKAQEITYKFPNIQEGEEIIEKFNTLLMCEVWVAFALIALLFWGIYCHLKNQKAILNAIKNVKKGE